MVAVLTLSVVGGVAGFDLGPEFPEEPAELMSFARLTLRAVLRTVYLAPLGSRATETLILL